jgi:hypothetical protein
MEARIDLTKSVPKDALHALYGLEQYIRKSGLEAKLLELVRMRFRKSMDADIVSICTAKTLEPKAKLSSASMP